MGNYSGNLINVSQTIALKISCNQVLSAVRVEDFTE
jgi:hypothetical protein